jgi:hypothetical protein
LSSSISATSSVSPYISSLLFSKTPLTADQQQYLKENYAITETADNTTVITQADGSKLNDWHGSFQLASNSSDSTIVYNNPTGSSPTNVSTDKTPTLADVAKAISGSALRNEDFNLLDTFFTPATSTPSGVNNQEPKRTDFKA